MDHSRKDAQEALRFSLPQALEQNPEATQRESATALVLSLDAIDYSIQAPGKRGLVKFANLAPSGRSLAYAYALNPLRAKYGKETGMKNNDAV